MQLTATLFSRARDAILRTANTRYMREQALQDTRKASIESTLFVLSKVRAHQRMKKNIRDDTDKYTSTVYARATNAQAKKFFTTCRANRRIRPGIDQKRANQ